MGRRSSLDIPPRSCKLKILFLPQRTGERAIDTVMEMLRSRCPGLEDGGRSSRDNTGRGKGRPPETVLEGLPPQAKALAVTLEGLGRPVKGFTQRVMWDRPIRRIIPSGLTADRGWPRPISPTGEALPPRSFVLPLSDRCC